MGEQNMQNLARALIQQASQDPKAMELLRQIMELAAAIQQEMQAMQQSGQLPNQQKVRAQLGAKLDYLNKLKGVCPEGTEKIYLKDGGCMCGLKAKKGTELKKESKKMNAVEKFKAEKAQNGIKTPQKSKNQKLDQAARDSIAINDHSDVEVMNRVHGMGKFNPKKENRHGGATWEPDRSKYPQTKKDVTKKNACGDKMKKNK